MSDWLASPQMIDRYIEQDEPAENDGYSIKTVTIPAIEQHNGIHSVTVKLMWECPVCYSPRGEVFQTISFDGSRRLSCDGWKNKCGHVDKYEDVRKEAAENGLNW